MSLLWEVKRVKLHPHLVALSILWLLFTACAPLTGTVSTAKYAEPPPQARFTVICPDSLSLTERNITALIEKKMSEHGYVIVASREAANVAVLYKYSIGSGRTHVSSQPDFVWGGQKVSSSTSYPRVFILAMVDLEKSDIPEKIEILWLGEIHSSGSSSNISRLVPYFIDIMFENYEKNVTNKPFGKVVAW
jgi:hypothetical protein